MNREKTQILKLSTCTQPDFVRRMPRYYLRASVSKSRQGTGVPAIRKRVIIAVKLRDS